jgi:hypothetical protein
MVIGTVTISDSIEKSSVDADSAVHRLVFGGLPLISMTFPAFVKTSGPHPTKE